MSDPIAEAVRRAVEYGAPPKIFQFDLDRSAVSPGSPGIYDGLVIAQWVDV